MDPGTLLALIGGGGALLKSLFGGDKGGNNIIVEKGHPLFDFFQTGIVPGSGGGSSSSSTTNSSQTQNINRTIMPVIAQAFQPGADMLRNALEQRLRFPTQFGQGLLAQGIQSTNDTYRGAEQGLMNRLSASGALGSPAAGVPLATLTASRASDIAKFRNQIPMMEREAQNQDLQLMQAMIQALGLGSHEKGKITTTGTSTTKGHSSGGGPQIDTNFLLQQLQAKHQGGGGAFDNLLPMLGLLLGSGALGGGKKSSSSGAGVP